LTSFSDPAVEESLRLHQQLTPVMAVQIFNQQLLHAPVPGRDWLDRLSLSGALRRRSTCFVVLLLMVALLGTVPGGRETPGWARAT